METPTPPPFSKKKIVVVAAFFVLFGIALLIVAYYLHLSEGFWRRKMVTVGIGTIVIFGIALVQGLVFLFSADPSEKKKKDEHARPKTKQG